VFAHQQKKMQFVTLLTIKDVYKEIQAILKIYTFSGCFNSISESINALMVIVDVVEEVVGLSVVERSLETLKKNFEQRPNDALPHIKSIQGLHKEVSSHHLEASHHTSMDSFFRLV
jgi:hypothetical protein